MFQLDLSSFCPHISQRGIPRLIKQDWELDVDIVYSTIEELLARLEVEVDEVARLDDYSVGRIFHRSDQIDANRNLLAIRYFSPEPARKS
jgi:hypothetical protein